MEREPEYPRQDSNKQENTRKSPTGKGPRCKNVDIPCSDPGKSTNPEILRKAIREALPGLDVDVLQELVGIIDRGRLESE